jgi:hypothetical protein
MGFAAVAIIRTLAVNLGAAHSWRHLPWLSERLLTVTLVVLLLYSASRWAGIAGIAAAQRIAPAYTWAASGLAGLLAWYELRPVSVAPAWVLLGFILLDIGLRRASVHLRMQAYLAFTAAFLRLFFVNLNAGGPLGEVSPRLYTTLPIALAFYFVYLRLESASDLGPFERRFRLPAFHSFLGLIAGAALARFELDADLVAAGWAALTLALIALAWKTGRRLFLHQALLLAFGVLFRGLLHNVYARSYFPAPLWHGPIPTLGPAVAFLFLTLPFAFILRRTEAGPVPAGRIAKVVAWLDRRPEQILFYIPFVLLTALIAVEVRIGLVTLVWGVEAVAIFLFAIRVKERSYRLCGLGLLLACVAKIVLRDVWGLVPRDRYLTFIVLGAALLGVSYLYTRYRDVLRQYL